MHGRNIAAGALHQQLVCLAPEGALLIGVDRVHAGIGVEHCGVERDFLEVHIWVAERHRADFMGDVFRIHDAVVGIAQDRHEQLLFRQA